jgi:hypothetical protein
MKRAAITILLMFSAPAFAGEALVCAPKSSVGFDFDKRSKTWHPTPFAIAGETHRLSRQSGKLVWSTQGGPSQVDIGCGEFDQYGFLKCGIVTTVNRKTLRYLSINPFGYVTNEPEGGDTPSMEIGTCSAQ